MLHTISNEINCKVKRVSFQGNDFSYSENCNTLSLALPTLVPYILKPVVNFHPSL